MTPAEVEALLAETRLGILTTLRADAMPVSVPVWYEWAGGRALIFSSATSKKVARIRRDRRASLLVARGVGEPEGWVALEGEVDVRQEGAWELAERLAQRYWDMTDPDHRSSVDSWREGADALRLLVLTPSEIRSYDG